MDLVKYSKWSLGAGLMVVLTACAQQPDRQAAGGRDNQDRAEGLAQEDVQSYAGQIQSLNVEEFGQVSGQANIQVREDSIQINVDVQELPSGVANLQILLGFPQDQVGYCPPTAGNGLGNGNANERASAPGGIQTPSGMPMILLQEDPTALPQGTEGGYTFQQSLSRSDLENAARQQFGMETVSFENMVLYVQGIPEGERVPGMQPPGTQPGDQGRATVPIACAEFEMFANGAANGY